MTDARTPGAPLDAAARIGAALCGAAFWDPGRRYCNWVGRSPGEAGRPGEVFTPETAALGPNLYAGVGGVALFLAELYRVTGDERCRETALGGLRCAIRQAGRRSPGGPWPLSFYSGDLGLACAADRAAGLTGDGELRREATALFESAAASVGAPHPLDIIGGNAGAILALLAHEHLGGGRSPWVLATELGNELLVAADRSGDVWTWPVERASGSGMGHTPLTGLSHGHAGIGVALLELFAATGRQEYLEAARGAFVYEDSIFSEEAGNWPDLRVFEDAAGHSAAPGQRFPVAWCHGAPGIALARLRAAVLDPPRRGQHLASARAALATTAAAVERAPVQARTDTTLCHGLSGLADVLLSAGRFLDEPGYNLLAGEAARAMIAAHGAAGDWPSGVPSGGPSPTLMLGSAGVGYFFLRLENFEVTPPLLLVGQ